MQIKEALRIAAQRCQNSSTPQLDARIMLCKVLSLTHEQLLIKYNDNLSLEEEITFFSLVERRVSMEPVAYIVGKREFYGMDFVVNKNVLIPRPETELLVQSVIDDYNTRCSGEVVKILELGTGSGAISVSIKTEIPLASIIAVDVSPSTLEVAKINALNNHAAGIQFCKSNWFENVKERDFDYIVSNPPYIDRRDVLEIAPETLLFEPELALYADDDGLASYETIISSASNYLKYGGKVFFEIGYKQSTEIRAILKNYSFADVIVKKDIAGHDRVIIASFK